jgi:hypothetical protein
VPDVPANLAIRQVARIILVGGLLLAFGWGLVWALNPSEGGVTFTAPDRDPAPAEEEGDDEEAADVEPRETDPAETPTPEPEPTPTGPPPEELIAAAPDPSSTSVQVLDAGGGPTRTLGVTDALEDLGYQVVNVTSSRTDVTETTVWYTDGHEDAGLALRARDDRFAVVEENERLSAGVNLHVLVGPDWR